MKLFLPLTTLFLVISLQVQAQEKEYSFLIVDSPAKLYTMRQYNKNFLSTYRLGVQTLNTILPDTIRLGRFPIAQKYPSIFVQLLVNSNFFTPLTHEEGHRSVLTNEGIGSISIPYFNKSESAYVVSVSNESLKNLRDTKLPTYIRLHIAGNESDYALALRSATVLSWNQESLDVVWAHHLLRKLSITLYYYDAMNPNVVDIAEETNELDRDIVGHDVLGAIRHLHRPNMEFYRYTDYTDLTDEEKQFGRRVGWRAFINLIDPMIVRKNGFNFKNGNKFNFAYGYGMAPFGDFIDQHFWLKTKHLNTHFYLREYQNRQTWFPEIGVEFGNIKIIKNLFADTKLYAWQQPHNLDFNISQGDFGGAIDVLIKYKFYSLQKNTAISLNCGVIAKTEGYLLEEMALNEHVGMRFGASLWLNN
jgi:hypothetical protein